MRGQLVEGFVQQRNLWAAAHKRWQGNACLQNAVIAIGLVGWLLGGVTLTLGQNIPAGRQVEMAVEAFQSGRVAEAEALLREALQKAPRNAHGWKVLGVVYASQGRHEFAGEPLSKACELNPNEPDACYYLARNHYLQNRFTESLAMFDKLHASARNDWRFQNGRGLALSGLGRFEEAEQAFLRASGQHRPPSNPDENPAVNLGSLYLKMGQPARALEALRQVTRKYPNAARAWFEQGKAELQLGALEDALRSLEQAVLARRGYAEAHLLQAKIYARLGDSEQAAVHRRLGGGR